MVKNKLYYVEVLKGNGETQVDFHRENRGRRSYMPTRASLQRLQPHILSGDLEVFLGSSLVTIGYAK